VESVAFSPDGHSIVTASGDAARIIDVKSGKETLRIRHDALVTSAAFSPDGHRVVTSSWDGTARVVDADTGREIARAVHDGHVDSVEFSPDGQRITTRAGTTRVFDAQNGRQIGPATEPARLVRSPNGRQVLQRVSTSLLFRRKPDTPTPDGVVVADARTGLEVARFGGPRYNASSFEGVVPIWLEPGKSIVFSPDGQRVATASFASNNDNTARIWDIADATKYDDDLISFACGQKLVGASRLSSADVAVVPLLMDREGDDVCGPVSLIQRILRWASRVRGRQIASSRLSLTPVCPKTGLRFR
jgi:WD40 repeat protein